MMNMNRNNMTSAITSAAVGIIAGTAAYMMSSGDTTMQRQTKKLKRTAGRAVKNAGIILDSVSQIMH
ncbi:MAG: hypothetical protein K0S22_1376 [Oscillospiraceae bacterium]|jgi:hypothetical protein|nr:hypothetical protein [Oscillospiraceae bacterium]